QDMSINNMERRNGMDVKLNEFIFIRKGLFQPAQIYSSLLIENVFLFERTFKMITAFYEG
ncbi:MAG TPA: hypothetical protein VLB50_04850, partial [Ignavibacteriaceae bacterium]|nr:hypothetical protein [Ignavibacteriaceae bacterium]